MTLLESSTGKGGVSLTLRDFGWAQILRGALVLSEVEWIRMPKQEMPAHDRRKVRDEKEEA